MKLEDCKVGMEIRIIPDVIPGTTRTVEFEYPDKVGKISGVTEDDMLLNVETPDKSDYWCFVPEELEPVEPLEETRHGHLRFYELLDSLADLHSRKNHDYAAGGNPLGNFIRRADLYGKYPGLDLSDPAVVAIVDAMKQLDAALWMYSNGHAAQVEGIIDRLRDVAVYALIAIVIEEEKDASKED